MRRLLLMLTLISAMIVVNGQKSIDALFDKYAGRDGFVTITLNSDLLKHSDFLKEDNSDNPMSGNINKIRILVQDDDNLKFGNFHDLIMKDINLNHYKEFMRVKESDQDVRMLVRTEGNRFKEFLLIAGGEDNVLIQIKGDMSNSEARKFSERAKKDHGMNMVEIHK